MPDDVDMTAEREENLPPRARIKFKLPATKSRRVTYDEAQRMLASGTYEAPRPPIAKPSAGWL